MRALVIAILSVPIGLILWYVVSAVLFLAFEVPDMGVSRTEFVPESFGDVAGLLYSSIFMVMSSTGRYGVIGIPVCIGIVACGAVVIDKLRQRRDTPPVLPGAGADRASI